MNFLEELNPWWNGLIKPAEIRVNLMQVKKKKPI